jgi:hypothetical protein
MESLKFPLIYITKGLLDFSSIFNSSRIDRIRKIMPMIRKMYSSILLKLSLQLCLAIIPYSIDLPINQCMKFIVFESVLTERGCGRVEISSV